MPIDQNVISSWAYISALNCSLTKALSQISLTLNVNIARICQRELPHVLDIKSRQLLVLHIMYALEEDSCSFCRKALARLLAPQRMGRNNSIIPERQTQTSTTQDSISSRQRTKAPYCNSNILLHKEQKYARQVHFKCTLHSCKAIKSKQTAQHPFAYYISVPSDGRTRDKSSQET